MDTDIIAPTLWSQFGASIDMLEAAIRACPDALWSRSGRGRTFRETAFHALDSLEHHLSVSPGDFRTPAAVFVTRDELLGWAARCRESCISRLASLTEETALARCGFPQLNMAEIELLLYAMRHLQHHVGQLALLVRQETDSGVHWVRKSTS